MGQIGIQLGRAVERERAADQAQRQQEALFQREKLAAMGTLLASVAHELNNPLAVILMQADLLLADAGSGPTGRYAADITEAARRCSGWSPVSHPGTPACAGAHGRRSQRPRCLHPELLAPALRVENIAVELRLARISRACGPIRINSSTCSWSRHQRPAGAAGRVNACMGAVPQTRPSGQRDEYLARHPAAIMKRLCPKPSVGWNRLPLPQ